MNWVWPKRTQTEGSLLRRQPVSVKPRVPGRSGRAGPSQAQTQPSSKRPVLFVDIPTEKTNIYISKNFKNKLVFLHDPPPGSVSRSVFCKQDTEVWKHLLSAVGGSYCVLLPWVHSHLAHAFWATPWDFFFFFFKYTKPCVGHTKQKVSENAALGMKTTLFTGETDDTTFQCLIL